MRLVQVGEFVLIYFDELPYLTLFVTVILRYFIKADGIQKIHDCFCHVANIRVHFNHIDDKAFMSQPAPRGWCCAEICEPVKSLCSLRLNTTIPQYNYKSKKL